MCVDTRFIIGKQVEVAPYCETRGSWIAVQTNRKPLLRKSNTVLCWNCIVCLRSIPVNTEIVSGSANKVGDMTSSSDQAKRISVQIGEL